MDFFGCPHKSVVKVRPTAFCIIAISEFPFFIIDINDIECVHFERVTFGIKNFDMAIIFKDFTTVKRINSIPIEHIEQIKQFLDETGIIYSEGAVAMNWTNVLNQIRTEFEAFLEAGAWRFLQDNGNSEDEEDEDKSFDVEDDEDGEDEDEESDFSEDEDDDEYSSDSGDPEDEEELSEEGLSWDEMERQAEEEDRKNASRRQTKDMPPAIVAQNKRRPQQGGSSRR